MAGPRTMMTGTPDYGAYAARLRPIAGLDLNDFTASPGGEYVRVRHPGRLQWQSEGEDIGAYVSREDMHDEDKAVARLRPAAS